MPVLKSLSALILLGMLPAMGACTSAPAPEAPPAAQALPALEQKPFSTLAQVMRAIPFTASNILFDVQSNDPGAPPKAGGPGGGATATFASVYGGWQQVEHMSLALSEMANLMMIPGRMCENGKPAPLDREDYRKLVQNLANVGQEAYKVAQTKNLEAMSEITNSVADACAQCHEIYRDKENLADRCVP